MNPFLSETAIKTGLFQLYLSDRYDKRGNIITIKGKALNAVSVFEDYCQAHSQVTLDELFEFEKVINGSIHMGGGKADSMRNLCYPMEIQKYTDIIRNMIEDKDIESYISNGGWIERKNGRDIKDNQSRYQEEIKDGFLIITVNHPSSNWHEWIKTLGDIPFNYTVEKINDGYSVKIPESADKTLYAKLFKQVFHKAAYCVACRVCEANCHNGCITFEKGLHIENCKHCNQCHNIDDARVILYALYKFAEACEGYYQFTLSRLLDHTVESAGISPSLIFGFDHDDMERFLNGLTANYPDFINVTFTHDLDKITLSWIYQGLAYTAYER